ncbi:hypothetical protein DRV85_09800 [Rhodosalinus halophilus]|uniref:Adenosylcobinamide-GDP ribazoletransferase n=1 Tax=Rhodosalinus halophilus TaxID=2259333 RepID=A0A365U894_9RHOB|nr:hypothetical protein [Rhodosalinus halophilus]RBI84950.1 hypothetical protein DRV85_09800 [Rhodosalinus halophilus]
MSDPRRTVMVPIARQCRMVAVALIASLWRTRAPEEIDAAIGGLPAARQSAVVGGVLGFLFLLSLFAAQFGLVGLALFWLAVILIVS